MRQTTFLFRCVNAGAAREGQSKLPWREGGSEWLGADPEQLSDYQRGTD
jgi:hypothetical protein